MSFRDKIPAMRAIAISLALLMPTSACTATFYARAAVHTENGLRVGNEAWDEHYNENLEGCKKIAKPETPEAEECFGPTFDQNKNIEIAIRSSVAILRAFWAGYAAGKNPKELRNTLAELPLIVKDLPDEFFKGIKKGR